MDEYEKSGITSLQDIKKRFELDLDPSTATMIEGGNISGGAETGSTGERDMHSDATSKKHLAPPARSDVRKEEDSSLSSGSGEDSALNHSNIDVGDGYGQDRLHETESTPSSRSLPEGHASDFQSAEGLASDMPDRTGIHEPASSGDRATDITGIPYIQ